MNMTSEGSAATKRGCIQRFLGLAGEAMSKEGDTAVEAMRKNIMFITSVLTLCAMLLSRILGELSSPGTTPQLSWVLLGIVVTTSCGCMAALFLKKCSSELFVCAGAAGWTVSIFVLDVFQTSGGEDRAYPLLIIIADLLIMARVRDRQILGFIGICVTWILFTYVEAFSRFGLYDIWGTADAESRAKICDCSNPPCEISGQQTIRGFIGTVTVILIDFSLTRRFALTMQQEQESIMTSVQVARVIAECLASFDLDYAELELSDSATLPKELHEALSTILANLRVYRPFLPDALFQNNHADARPVSAMPFVNADGCVAFLSCVLPDDLVWTTGTSEEYIANLGKNAPVGAIVRATRAGNNHTVTLVFRSCKDALHFAATAVIGESKSASLPAKWKLVLHYGEATVSKFDLAPSSRTQEELNVMIALGLGGITASTAALAELDRDSLREYTLIPHNKKRYRGVATSMHVTELLPKAAGEWVDELKNRMGHDFPGDSQQQAVSPQQTGSVSEPSNSSAWPSRAVAEETNRQSIASVLTVKLNILEYGDTKGWQEVEQRTSRYLEVIHQATKTTEGVLHALVNTTIFVSWAAFRKCQNHMQRCKDFMGTAQKNLLELREFEGDIPAFHAGWSIGPVCGGKLSASSTAYFMTILGPCADLSLSLCLAAAELRTYALLASASAWPLDSAQSVMSERHIRPVDIWNFKVSQHQPSFPELAYQDEEEMVKQTDGADEELIEMVEFDILNSAVTLHHVVVYEVKIGGGHRSSAADLSESFKVDSWSRGYANAFFRKNLGALQHFSQHDPILKQVVAHMNNGTHLSHAFMQWWR